MLRFIADRIVLWGLGAAIAVTLLVVWFWPRHSDHRDRSPVRDHLQRIFDGARAYYLDERPGGGPVAGFPHPSTVSTPPVGSCCRQGGECRPDPALWQHEPWTSLAFSVDRADRYSYRYQVAADGRSFTVTAVGDLDCDGEYATFSMTGTTGSDGGVGGAGELFRDNETE